MRKRQRNWFFLFWCVTLIAVIYLLFGYRRQTRYVSIVETKSHLLGAGESGIIKDMLVSAGQFVESGQIIVTLDLSDLETELHLLTGELAALQDEGDARQDWKKMEFERIRLQLETDLSNLAEDLARLKSKRTELSVLEAEITRLEEAEQAGPGSSQALAALKIRRRALADYLNTMGQATPSPEQRLEEADRTRMMLDKVDQDGIVGSMLPGSMERVEKLRRDIASVEHRMRSRTVTAPCDGYVDELFARGGDVVRAFAPILSLDESTPEYMTVYIPEKADLPLRVGMEVKIYSPKLKRYMPPGTIATIHPGLSRTPDRLSFMRQTFWARRIQVRLNHDHGLLPGEVVYARIDHQPE